MKGQKKIEQEFYAKHRGTGKCSPSKLAAVKRAAKKRREVIE